MIRGLFSLFSFNYPRIIVYMLQNTEYDIRPYLAWYWRTANFNQVARRRTLDMTKRAKLLLLALRTGMVAEILAGFVLIAQGFFSDNIQRIGWGAVIVLLYPIIWAHVIAVPLAIVRSLIVAPKDRRLVLQSKQIFQNHPGIIIAVAGSYGKTTVKELLNTILSEGKRVAATPANKNVAVSHAVFARNLKGNEEVLIIEYGEGKPGDVARFAATTRPDMGIITGLAPAHLDAYKSLSRAAADIFSLADYVGTEHSYVNAESTPLVPYLRPGQHRYDQHHVLGWAISNIKVEVNQLQFVMKKNGRTLRLRSGLIGRHLVGTLALCAALAAELGMSDAQIQAGVAKTAPFEHRMQPRLFAGGWLIDDTYNGNLEGARAGLALLQELPAHRKTYVTPGLVDQGDQFIQVHQELGELIAHAAPDKVVLMNNSATKYIQAGMHRAEYEGMVIIEDDPLDFYTNIDKIMAVGDIVMMQNDLPDNYN